MENIKNQINILYLDDEPSILRVIKNQIEIRGYNCLITEDYKEAIEILGSNDQKIDIFIIDYLLEGIFGDKVIEMTRKFNKDVYIIMLTSQTNSMPGQFAMKNLGIDNYSPKGTEKDFNMLFIAIEAGVKAVRKYEEFFANELKSDGLKFEEKLKFLREKAGKDQNDLAVALGVKRSTISSYEQGAIRPSFEMLKKLATYFGVSYDYLME